MGGCTVSNNKLCGIIYGAAHSCSSFADLVLKSLQVVKEKLALTSHQFFMTRSEILEQLWAAPQ
jgi:hypothetical protein